MFVLLSASLIKLIIFRGNCVVILGGVKRLCLEFNGAAIFMHLSEYLINFGFLVSQL